MVLKHKMFLRHHLFQPPPEKSGEEEPSAKKQKVEDLETTAMVKKTMYFVPLDKSLEADWTSGALAKRIKRMNPAFFLLHVS